jgi:hypothetical protein
LFDRLPPANPNARGLHLTDEEWRTLLGLVEAEQAIMRARVYGSRQAGTRRPKDSPQPLDIDLAIEVRTDDPSEAFTVFLSIARQLKAASELRIQVEDLTDVTSGRFAVRQAGVLILDRTLKS